MCIQEVGDWDGMGSLCDVRCLEDLLDMALSFEAHVLLAESTRVLLNVCMLL